MALGLVCAQPFVSISQAQSSLFDDPELRPPELTKRPGNSPATAPAATPNNMPPNTPVAPVTPVKPPAPGTPTAPATTPPAPVKPATKPAPPPNPSEPDVQQMFASLYGVDARRVEGTPSTKDDLEFARKLLGAVPAASESRPLQRLMLERAYLYATKDVGGTADEASIIRNLRQLFPSESLLWDERWLLLQDKVWRSSSAADRLMGGDIYRRLLQQSAERLTATGKYADAQAQLRRAADIARGDADAQAEIKEMLRHVADRQRFDRRATELLDKAIKLQGAIDAASLTEAVELLGVVLPRLADIKKLPAADDKVLAYLVAMLQVPDNRLTTAQAAWLGDYFRKAAERPQVAYRLPLLRAAATWYSHFLSRHLPLDAERLRVLLSAQQVAASLAEAAPARTYAFEIGGTAASLIKLIEPARHRISGDWQVTGATAAADAVSGPAQMVLPLAPGDAYEITMQYSSEGASAVGLNLPVGSANAAISREADETSISTSASASRKLSDGFPSVSSDTERHTLYARVVVKGGRAAIIVAVDGYEAGKWEGRIKDLAAPADLELPDRSAIGVFVRGGKARVTDLSVHSLKSAPRLVQIAMPDELPLDGSRPRDAVISRRADNSVAYTHHGVTLNIDPSLPGGGSIIISEPADDVRIVRNGFTTMMSNTANLTPLRMEYRRYKELLAMSASVPKPFEPSDLNKLKQLSHDYDSATTPDARQRAEQGLFAAMHVLGDRYQKSITSWARSVQKTLTAEEAKLMVSFGNR